MAHDWPLPALRHLSALTWLVRLSLHLWYTDGKLPPDLLPALGSLAHLALKLSCLSSVAWQRPDGSGPMLRQLALVGGRLGLPPDRLLPALRRLEGLELRAVVLEQAQLGILPQLPQLTLLTLGLSMAGVHLWPVVLRCTGLQELG